MMDNCLSFLYNKGFRLQANCMTYLHCHKNHVLRFATLCLTMFFVSGNLLAQGVYKWVDKDGKVHYGDKRNAPSTSKESDIKPVKMPGTSSAATPTLSDPFRDIRATDSPRIMQTPNFDRAFGKPIGPIVSIPPSVARESHRMAKPEKWPEYKVRMPDKSPENAHIAALGEATLQKCIALAVDLHSMDFGAERNAAHDQFLASCPKVKVECKAYRKRPAMNSCEVTPAEEKGAISIFRTTD